LFKKIVENVVLSKYFITGKPMADFKTSTKHGNILRK